MRFAGQTVVVTGASRGLGRAIAVGFGGEGAWVAVLYRDRETEAAATLTQVRAAGGDGLCLRVDVTSDDAVAAALGAVVEQRGGIDALVNNAAVVRDERFALSTLDAWEETLQTNLLGAVRCSRLAARRMLERRAGSIVNVGSVAALRASPGQAAYGAAKAALLALTRTLAAELAPRGIRVNAVVPGLLDTGMGVRLDARIKNELVGHIPLGRVGTGDEVARAVLFLASEAASYIVGQALVVDGGVSL